MKANCPVAATIRLLITLRTRAGDRIDANFAALIGFAVATLATCGFGGPNFNRFLVDEIQARRFPMFSNENLRTMIEELVVRCEATGNMTRDLPVDEVVEFLRNPQPDLQESEA